MLLLQLAASSISSLAASGVVGADKVSVAAANLAAVRQSVSVLQSKTSAAREAPLEDERVEQEAAKAVRQEANCRHEEVERDLISAPFWDQSCHPLASSCHVSVSILSSRYDMHIAHAHTQYLARPVTAHRQAAYGVLAPSLPCPQPDKYIVHAEVPGVKKDDIKLSVENGQRPLITHAPQRTHTIGDSLSPTVSLLLLGVLTITAEKRDQHEEKKVTKHSLALQPNSAPPHWSSPDTRRFLPAVLPL